MSRKMCLFCGIDLLYSNFFLILHPISAVLRFSVMSDVSESTQQKTVHAELNEAMLLL